MPPDFDPPFCPGGMLMGTNDRTIDTVLLPVNPTFGIGLLLEGFEHPLPHASFDPSIEAADPCSMAHTALAGLSKAPRFA